MIKVSVIVPVYNKEKTIAACLNSLVEQTLSEIEILVINDGSTDKSAEIIKTYQKKYKNIHFINRSENMGIGKTRNEGLAKAKGKYIGFVDSDDYVEKDMYEKYYTFAEKKKLDIVTGHYYKEKETGEKSVFETPLFTMSNVHKTPQLLLFDDYGPCNKIFSKKILADYHIQFEENMKYEDMPFVMKALYHASKIGHIEKPYYHYIIHADSETTIMDERVFDIFKVMDIINAYYEKDSKLEEALIFLNIHQITRYMLRQKYQKEKTIRHSFIDTGYTYLDTKFPGWRKNPGYRETSFLKRCVKNHKWCTKLYCALQKN